MAERIRIDLARDFLTPSEDDGRESDPVEPASFALDRAIGVRDAVNGIISEFRADLAGVEAQLQFASVPQDAYGFDAEEPERSVYLTFSLEVPSDSATAVSLIAEMVGEIAAVDGVQDGSLDPQSVAADVCVQRTRHAPAAFDEVFGVGVRHDTSPISRSPDEVFLDPAAATARDRRIFAAQPWR